MSWINSNATYKQNSKNDLSFYHGFSKTPVEPNTSNGYAVTTLANATTKSGHTVSATEVWASEIPWFGLVPSKAVAVTRLSGITKKNDLVRVNGDQDYIYIGEGNEEFTEDTWSTYWNDIKLSNGAVLQNAAGEDVLRYYEKQQMQALEPNNNAGIDSKGYATRLFVDEDTHEAVTTVGQGFVISQFAAGTDNIKNGIASSELNPVLYLNDKQKIAGTDYYDYNVSGTILWNSNVKSSTPQITCFRYIGKTVTKEISDVKETTDALSELVTGISQVVVDIQSELSTATGETLPAAIEKALEDAKAYTDKLHKVSFTYVVLGDNETLPEASAETLGKIYLEPKQNTTDGDKDALNDDYIEYLTRQIGEGETAEFTWEKIGTTATDLTGYAKVEDLEGKVANVTGGSNGIAITTTGTGSDRVATLAVDPDIEVITNSANVITSGAVASKISSLNSTKNHAGIEVKQENGVITSLIVTPGTVTANNTSVVTGGVVYDAINTMANASEVISSITDGKGTTVTGAITVKDGRETVTEDDLWGTTATLNTDGTLIIAHDWITNHNASTSEPWNTSITKVEDNKAYTGEAGDTFYANIQTERIKDGTHMFYCSNLSEFSSDLSSLMDGTKMFYRTLFKSFDDDLSSLVNGHYMFGETQLTSFNSDLSSLVNGLSMFQHAQLTSFNGDLSSLVDGSYMFYFTQLTSFNGDLSSLVDGNSMFYFTQLTSFNGDLSSLVDGNSMFGSTTLTSFNGDLSSLVNGNNMFTDTQLDMESLETICDTLPKKSDFKTWNFDTKTYEDWNGNSDFVYLITKLDKNYNKVQATKSILVFDVATIDITYSSVPTDENTRNAITALFEETANTKGWTIITNAELGGTYTPSVAMTDGTVQRYIYAIKHEADEKTATYVDGEGKYWTVDTAEAIIGPNVKYWSLFATVEDAITEWGLTPYEKA